MEWLLLGWTTFYDFFFVCSCIVFGAPLIITINTILSHRCLLKLILLRLEFRRPFQTSLACSTAKLASCNFDRVRAGINFNTANDIYGPFSAERSRSALNAWDQMMLRILLLWNLEWYLNCFIVSSMAFNWDVSLREIFSNLNQSYTKVFNWNE